MMSTSNSHPKWWQLYLSLPLLIALFIVDSRLRISIRGHQAVQIGIVLLVYGLIHLWLKANSGALSAMDREQNYGRIRVFRIPLSQLPESNYENRPVFERPDLAIKDALSDTSEMDCIDSVAYPVDEASQESKKE